MSVQYHNLMEDIVLRYVDGVIKSGGICDCDTCKSDVIAYALNHLQPHYVATTKGQLIVKAQSYEVQFRTDVLAALSAAVEQVKKYPRHEENK